jgi:hypothetical protein
MKLIKQSHDNHHVGGNYNETGATSIWHIEIIENVDTTNRVLYNHLQVEYNDEIYSNSRYV